MEKYKAFYGNASCTAWPTKHNGEYRYFTVYLDKDPGFGSMMFTRIARSQIRFVNEPPPEVLPY
jgi:hypothetical protein